MASSGGWKPHQPGEQVINIARRMKTKQTDKKKKEANVDTNQRTLEAYKALARNISRKEELTEIQKEQIMDNWIRDNVKGKKMKTKTKEEIAKQAAEKVDEVQKLGAEIKEILEQIDTCDLANVIHAAKIARYGEVHTRLAQSYLGKAKGEVHKAKKESNSAGNDGGKQLARAI